MDFFSYEAHVEDIHNQNDDHVDLEVDESWCFKIVRSFKAPLSTQETVSVEYAPACGVQIEVKNMYIVEEKDTIDPTCLGNI